MIAHLTAHWHWYAFAAYVILETWLGATPRTEAGSTPALIALALRRLVLLILRRSPATPPIVQEIAGELSREPPPEPQRPRIELVRPGVGPLVALVLVLGAGAAHAQDAAAPLADMPPPPVDAGPWIPLALVGLVGVGALGLLLLMRRRDPRMRGLVLVAALGLGSSACASWRNEEGGYDPIGAAGRERLAARVDCLGPVVLEASGRVALGALQLVLTGQQTNPSAWRDLLAPVVRQLEPRVLACLRAPAVAVRVTTDPPAIAVERAP